jgi:hypothetical protein
MVVISERCQPWFYPRLGGVSRFLVRRGGIQLGVVLSYSQSVLSELAGLSEFPRGHFFPDHCASAGLDLLATGGIDGLHFMVPDLGG